MALNVFQPSDQFSVLLVFHVGVQKCSKVIIYSNFLQVVLYGTLHFLIQLTVHQNKQISLYAHKKKEVSYQHEWSSFFGNKKQVYQNGMN